MYNVKNNCKNIFVRLFWKNYFREQKKRKSQYTKMSIKIYQQLIELDETRQSEVIEF